MVTHLKPVNGRKSFGGKALVISNGKDCFLQSYSTVVAGRVGGEIRRYWSGRTKTTSCHIAAFLSYVGVDMSVDEFYNIPLSESPEA